MRRISVLLILFLFASTGRFAAKPTTPLLVKSTPRPSPISTPTPQPSSTPVAAAQQNSQNLDWIDVCLAFCPTCLSMLGTAFLACPAAYLAWKRWRKDRAANALDLLYQEYQGEEFAKALRKVGEFKWDENSPNNRYALAREFLFDAALKEEREERDKARRIVTTFWYRVAYLLDRGIIQGEDTLVLFGPPSGIIKKLEALEVVKADQLGGEFPIEWPPLALLDNYRKRRVKTHFPTLPWNPEEFDAWKEDHSPQHVA